jgi:hypothetical protein
MNFLRLSINSLPPIGFSIGADIAPILASFWSADSDGVIATLHPLVIPFLNSPSPVVAAILTPLRSLGL